MQTWGKRVVKNDCGDEGEESISRDATDREGCIEEKKEEKLVRKKGKGVRKIPKRGNAEKKKKRRGGPYEKRCTTRSGGRTPSFTGRIPRGKIRTKSTGEAPAEKEPRSRLNSRKICGEHVKKKNGPTTQEPASKNPPGKPAQKKTKAQNA